MSSESRIPFAIFISVLLAGCVAGENAATSPPSTYPVQIKARSLEFSAAPQPQQHAGVVLNLAIRDNLPQLYYRYEVTSRINGSYFMMPNPPKLYTVYRIPFYQNIPAAPVVKFTLTNNSQQVIETGHSICAFDLDGQTILSKPVNIPDLLPGHTAVARIEGPTFDQLQGHASLTVWIYHLGDGTDGTPYKWVLPYQLTEQTRSAQAELVGESPREEAVADYRGRIEPAANSPAPPDHP